MNLDLASLGYEHDAATRLWIRPGAPTFAYNDGDEHEAWVADVVRAATDTSSSSRELETGIRDWPSLYHLSHLRGNVVRPFVGELEGPVLEIGAGTGAITRVLGEHGLDVLAVEGSPRRAAVAADRCRDLPNVRVVADTVQAFGHPARFRTVVLVGVLEYARMFGFDIVDRDPVDVMLEHVAGLVAEGGELVLAIENQLGLKYFAGFPEDHLGRRMVGVEDRYGPTTAVTFGRVELARRLRAAGLGEHRWLYPFPDYKLPTTVVSDRGLAPGSGFDAGPLVAATGRSDHQEPAVTAFDLTRAWGPVARNGLLADLSSSFVVRATTEPRDVPREAPLAWYFGSADRRPEFRKIVEFVPVSDGVRVTRRRTHPALPDEVGSVRLVLEDEDYQARAPWTHALHAVLARPGWTVDEVATWFGTWLDAVRRRAGLPEGSTDLDAVVPADLLDALPRNLLSGTTQFFDLEWHATGSLTFGHIVFRALYDTLASVGPVAVPRGGTATVGALLADVAAAHGLVLSPERLATAWEHERRFQSDVLGSRIEADLPTVLAAALTTVPTQDDERWPGTTSGAQVEQAASAAAAHFAAQAAEREAELTAEIETRGRELDRLRAALDVLHEQLARVEQSREQIAKEHGRLERDGEVLRHQLAVAHDHGATVDAALVAARATGDALRRELDAYPATLSWRVTRPLRGARTQAGRALRLAGRARRALVRRPRPTGSPVTFPPVPSTPPDGPPTRDDLDLTYYRRRNDDLDHLDDVALAQHYAAHGQHEGRRGRSLLDTARVVENGFSDDRERVLLVLHEATRTGAPVLGWNLVRELRRTRDVVVVLLQGGEISREIEREADATVTLVGAEPWHPSEARILAEDLVARFGPSWAVANSVATHPMIPALEDVGVPAVVLVHEFASSMRPQGVLAGVFATASEVVFPAPIVAESMRREYADLLAREHRIVAQGQSQLPGGGSDEHEPRVVRLGPDGIEADLPERSLDEFLAGLDPTTVLVVGAGTISPRKGVEFFVQAADLVRRLPGECTVAFAWIGHRFGPLQWYVEELHEQVRRSEVSDVLTFLAPTADLGPLYERSDLFLLSSRLDPLPNVTIDAALSGTPVVAFAGASGFAEWLQAEPRLEPLVVPHLDVAAAAHLVRRLAEDETERRTLGDALRESATLAFDMHGYADRIVELGGAARAATDQERRDVATIAASGTFDVELYAGADSNRDPLDVIREYVHRSRLVAPRGRARTGLLARRPAAGFHPLVYAERADEYDESRDGDPYAHYLRRGRPAGPWVHPVVTPGGPTASDDVRVLVHGHFHYTELVDDLVERLGNNEHEVDLHLTTTSDERADDLRRRLDAAGALRWTVETVPNRGRDLAPLVTALGASALDGYDLVLHVHGKRSPHVTGDVADRWRTFLWENLVGGEHPMLDVALGAFAADPTLGLLWPEDPHLNDWDLNRPHGEDLARRLSLRTPLPNHLDFPMGAMFWARPAALRPLLDAGLTWEDYPAEPLPIDGTMLHALERLLPLVAADAGFGFATTRVPGVTR